MATHDTHDAAQHEWLTTSEAARLLPGVQPRTLTRWAQDGKVPHVALPSGRLRFRRSDVEALLTPSTDAAALASGTS